MTTLPPSVPCLSLVIRNKIAKTRLEALEALENYSKSKEDAEQAPRHVPSKAAADGGL